MARWNERQDKPWRERFEPYTTSRGYRVVPVYYRMIHEYDPDRGGLEWYNEKRKQAGEKKWLREQEIDFSAAEGGLVYPEWDKRIHVLYDYLRLREEWTYFCVVDPGVKVTAALWFAIIPKFKLPDDQITGGWVWLFDEYYEGGGVKESDVLTAAVHAENIRKRTQHHCNMCVGLTRGGGIRMDGQAWLRTTLIDPSAYVRNHDLGTVAQRYIDNGITRLTEGSRDKVGGIEKVKELELCRPGILHPNGLSPLDSRGWCIKYTSPHMKYYNNEKKNYKYKQGSDKTIDVRDHLMDAERMGCVFVQNISTFREKRPLSSIGKKMMEAKRDPDKRRQFIS